MEHLPVKELDELQDIVPTGDELTLLWQYEKGVGHASLLDVRKATATYIDSITVEAKRIDPDAEPTGSAEETTGDPTGRHRDYVFHFGIPSGVSIDDVSIGDITSLPAGSAPTAAIHDVSVDDETTDVDERKTHKRYKVDFGIPVPYDVDVDMQYTVLDADQQPTSTWTPNHTDAKKQWQWDLGLPRAWALEMNLETEVLPEGSAPYARLVQNATANTKMWTLQIGVSSGAPFTIAKLYSSIADMTADYDTEDVKVGQFVVIDTGNVEDEDNAKLFMKGETSWELITDMSGATGLRGPQGAQGEKGEDGTVAFDALTDAQKAMLKGGKGDNAYKVWLDYGNEGSEADYLASLKGADGIDGADGEPLDGLMRDDELRSAGADFGVPYLSEHSLVYHLDGDLSEARGGAALATSGTVAFDATGAIPPNARNTLEGSATGAFTATIPLGEASTYCTDFYIKVVDAPADCVLLEIGSDDDKVRLLRSNGGEWTWRHTAAGDSDSDGDSVTGDSGGGGTADSDGDGTTSTPAVVEEVPLEVASATPRNDGEGALSDWLHIAVSFRDDAVYAWWGSNRLARWERYHTAEAVASVVIGGGATIALDEVMADATVAETEAQFRERTTTPMAWAARKNERAGTLMFADPTKVETNLDQAPAIQAAIQAAKDACVPLGFVYTQYPFMQAPDVLWPWAKWLDVSAQYEGAFFRALGGDSAEEKPNNSAAWEEKQAEGLPNITGRFSGAGRASGAFTWEQYCPEGCGLTKTFGWLQFHASNSNPIYGASEHVTPVNYAVRVWQRIA